MTTVYPLFKKKGFDGTDIDIAAGTLGGAGNGVKCVLLSSTYVYNAAHEFHNDLSGIIATSAALTGGTWLTDGGTGFQFDAADIVFSAVTTGSTVVAAALFLDTGTSGTSPLIAYDAVTSTPTNGGDITISFGANIFKID